MKGSLERVRAVIGGQMPDRPPLYELLRNDAVIEHFAGQPISMANPAQAVFAAYAPAVDATRPPVRLPEQERLVTRPDGRQQRHDRWTIWTEHRRYADSDAYAEAKKQELASESGDWTEEDQRQMDAAMDLIAQSRKKLGEVFFFPSGVSLNLMDIYGEVGLEMFSYCLVDHPDIIDELLERNVRRGLRWIEHLPADHGIEAMFCGDDVAYKSGPLLSPAWMADHYFPRMARLNEALHRRGISVLFHSDGNLMPILGLLVDAGIDGLNPIEIMAGMDVGEIHRLYPKLYLCGGIDVSQLLPFGTAAQVRDATRRAIDAAEGRLMVGSSTELNDDVPLENFLAVWETVLGTRY